MQVAERHSSAAKPAEEEQGLYQNALRRAGPLDHHVGPWSTRCASCLARNTLSRFGVLPPFRGPGAEQCETRDKHQERPQSPASVYHLLSSAERTARAALRSGSACRAAQRGCVEAIVTQAFRRELCIVGEGMSPPNWPNPTSSSGISTTFGTPFGAWTGGKTAPCRSRGRCGRQSRENESQAGATRRPYPTGPMLQPSRPVLSLGRS
jgi:hypothetical protein